MDAIFIQLSVFEAKRADYLSDEQFKEFQQMLLSRPAVTLSLTLVA